MKRSGEDSARGRGGREATSDLTEETASWSLERRRSGIEEEEPPFFFFFVVGVVAVAAAAAGCLGGAECFGRGDERRGLSYAKAGKRKTASPVLLLFFSFANFSGFSCLEKVHSCSSKSVSIRSLLPEHRKRAARSAQSVEVRRETIERGRLFGDKAGAPSNGVVASVFLLSFPLFPYLFRLARGAGAATRPRAGARAALFLRHGWGLNGKTEDERKRKRCFVRRNRFCFFLF